MRHTEREKEDIGKRRREKENRTSKKRRKEERKEEKKQLLDIYGKIETGQKE